MQCTVERGSNDERMNHIFEAKVNNFHQFQFQKRSIQVIYVYSMLPSYITGAWVGELLHVCTDTV